MTLRESGKIERSMRDRCVKGKKRMEKMTLEQVQTAVKTMAQVAKEKEAYFCELDGVMGDADFGVSLATGFGSVMDRWDTYDMSTIGTFLLGVTSAITSCTGGCSGPVWGTLFMRTGMMFKDKTELGLQELADGLNSAIEGISKRGGAHLGDKTLMDALDALAKSLEASAGTDCTLQEALDRAAEAACETRETTKQWVARRGRQSFTGDRSVGTYDPGIVAIGDMAAAIAEALKH